MKKATLLLFASALFLGMLTLTLRELRNWSLGDSTPSAVSSFTDSARPDTIIIAAQSEGVIQTQALTESRGNAITRSISEVAPAVVGISVTQIRYSQKSVMSDPFWRFMMPGTPRWFQETVSSIGSGFIYDSEGFIITNAHVVENAVDITVTLADGSQHKAELIGLDEQTDLALIRIKERGTYPAAGLGNSDDIIMGEWVIALGNPFGLFSESRMPIATAGIISSLHMDFGFQQSGRVYQDMIQTDAAINSGNSGGPLVNAQGEVIGINTFIFSGGGNNSGSIGIGFALPINRAMDIIQELRSKGFIDRNYSTGMSYRNNSERLAQVFGLGASTGVIVVDVKKGSPAERAKVQVGDVVLGVDGQRIANDVDIFTYFIGQNLRRGDVITLNVLRGEERMDLPLELGETNP